MSLANLVVLVIEHSVVPIDQKDSLTRSSVRRACVVERSTEARRRRMKSAIAESVGLRTQPNKTQLEATAWQAAELRTNGVIETLKKSIFTLGTEAA